MKINQPEVLQFTLLSNGLDFIISALEYLSGNPTQRDLKYAVLHLCSGIELVLKYRLENEHWSLIFPKVDKATKESYESGDFNSVSYDECLTRLSGICGIEISDAEKKQLEGFRKRRNRLEHFGLSDSYEAVVASTSNALSFIIDFVTKEIDPEEPEIETIAEIRKNLSEFKRFVTDRLSQIEAQLHGYSFVSTCNHCLQETTVVGDNVSCLFCGHHFKNSKEAAHEYVNDILGESQYEAATQGGEWPVYRCPECWNETLVHDNAERFICFDCGEKWDNGDMVFCDSCGSPFQTHEDGQFMCGDCFEHRLGDD